MVDTPASGRPGPEASALRTELVDPLIDPRWPELVACAPLALPFHHPAWLRLLQTTYGYPVAACAVADSGGRLVAGLPFALISSRLTGRRLAALPFTDACPPLALGGVGVLDALVEALAAERRRTGLDLEVRAALDAPGAHVVPRFVVHRLSLHPGPGALLHQVRPAARRGIAKARREGVVVRHATDGRALDAFFALHVRTRRRLGVPTQPRRFVRGLAALFAEGLGWVSLAELDGRVIAAAVFLTTSSTCVYKYGASDPGQLRHRPNNLIFADAIEHACRSGFEVLDFGRTAPANEGLRRFKAAWGAIELPLHHTYFAARAPAPGPRWRDALLELTVRRSPPLVGRWIGAALYRHVG